MHILGVDISEIGTNIEVSVVQSEDKITDSTSVAWPPFQVCRLIV